MALGKLYAINQLEAQIQTEDLCKQLLFKSTDPYPLATLKPFKIFNTETKQQESKNILRDFSESKLQQRNVLDFRFAT